ncbi:hypothetical protein C0991_007633 [Blastosporella zonata]|nr:hypothetical protein C0991_007633 [Blastosporella zonata]
MAALGFYASPSADGRDRKRGLLGNGAYGQVVLASAKDNENGDLYAVKILRKAEETNPFQELFTLDLILEASSGVETNKGVVFLQRLREAFHDEERVHVLVLDYHPAELSDPEIASHFLLANDSRFGLPASVSLPVTFAHRLTSRRPQDETLQSLLSHNPDDRLCWPDLKDHEFLYPLREMWEDIVELKHPPCPDPPTSSVYTDACPVLEGEQIVDFPSQEHSFYEDQGEEQKFSDSGLFNSSLSISLVKTWPPRLSDASSGDESIPDALPSSASIWIFDRAHDADFGVDDSGFSASSSEIAVLGGSKKHSAIAPALQSPFSSTPVLEHHHHLDSDLIKNSLSASERVEQPFVSGDLIAPEDLTWSLLEAMDKRDRLISERQRGRRIFREGRKMASGGFRRIFERLFTS